MFKLTRESILANERRVRFYVGGGGGGVKLWASTVGGVNRKDPG